MEDPTKLLLSYYPRLIAGDTQSLIVFFKEEPMLFDPLEDAVQDAAAFRRYVPRKQAWLSERKARFEAGRLTATAQRCILEGILHLEQKGKAIPLPIAVAAECDPSPLPTGEPFSEIRIYHSLWPLLGRHQVRLPLLNEPIEAPLPDVIERYQTALANGDLPGILASFDPQGYAREPAGGEYVYHGHAAIEPFYAGLFSNEGGIGLQHVSITDDGVACAIEYNVVRFGDTQIQPQPGIAVYERGPSGLLIGARIYDDVDPPHF